MRFFFLYEDFFFFFRSNKKKYCMMAEITQSKQTTGTKRLNWKTSPTSRKPK